MSTSDGGSLGLREALVNQIIREAIGIDIILLNAHIASASEPQIRRNWANEPVLVVPIGGEALPGATVHNLKVHF
eukprot:2799890-Prymnesium_polylepis.1